jgi:hypothetical protein
MLSPVLSPSSSRRFWESRATRLARRINVAAWLGLAAPTGFFVATGFAVAFYALRRVRQPLDLAWLALVAVLLVAAVGCWWRARSGFFGPDEARVLLETRLRLDTRLTAAALGLVPWPAEPVELPSILRWRLNAPLAWVGGAAALLALALLAPVPREGGYVRPSALPPALLQTQEMLAELKQINAADPQAIQQFEERTAELARRPADEQYSHSALEAADALRDQTSAAAAGLARGLDSASSALRSANTDADMKGAAGRLAAALSGLRNGGLPANQNLLTGLPGSEGALGNLTAEQREQLARQLAELAKGAAGVAGAAGAGAGIGRGAGQRPGRGYGPGGEGGGGDTAPLTLSSQQSDAGDGKSEGLSADALKRFALGDKLGTTSGAHQVDPEKAGGPVSAGAVATPASGGDVVWVNRLTPAERAAVKKFFK